MITIHARKKLANWAQSKTFVLKNQTTKNFKKTFFELYFESFKKNFSCQGSAKYSFQN